MLTQSQHIFEILLGRDSGWNAQRRRAATIRGRIVDRVPHACADRLHHRRHRVSSIDLAPGWLSPALIGLFLAVPLSRPGGSVAIGRGLARLGLLRTPEEADVPELVVRRQEILDGAPRVPEMDCTTWRTIVRLA